MSRANEGEMTRCTGAMGGASRGLGSGCSRAANLGKRFARTGRSSARGALSGVGRWRMTGGGCRPERRRPTPSPTRTSRLRDARRVMWGGFLATVLIVGTGCGLLSAGGGAPTPQEAVTDFLAALARGQVAGAFATLAPGERAAILPPLESVVAQLDRLGFLVPHTSVTNVSWASVRFSGVRLRVAPAGPRMEVVSFAAGIARVTVNAAAVPLDPLARKVLHTAPPQAGASTREFSLARLSFPLITVRQGGRWYVSPDWTIVRAAVGPGTALDPVMASGSATPAAAADRFLTALLTGDLRQVIAVTDPAEGPALHAYGGLLVSRATAALALFRQQAHVRLRRVVWKAFRVGDGTLMSVAHIALSASVGGSSLTYAGGCAVVRAVGQPSATYCPAHLSGPSVNRALAATLGQVAARGPHLGFVTVEAGGRWFVSPIRTVLDDIASLLGALTPSVARAMLRVKGDA